MTSPIDGVGPQATLPSNYNPARADVNASGSGAKTQMFDSQMFLQLLVAQLKYQDPTNPTDTSEFMSQSAMLSQVETMNSMSATLTELVASQQTASATSLIGKAISFVDPNGRQAEGVVEAVSLSQGRALLHVGDFAVPLAGVLAVADPIPVAPSPGDSDAPSDGGDAVPEVDSSGNDVIPTDSTDHDDPAPSETSTV